MTTVKSHTFRALARLRTNLYANEESTTQRMAEANTSLRGAVDPTRTFHSVVARTHDVSGGPDAR
jgi:hypothetical protein